VFSARILNRNKWCSAVKHRADGFRHSVNHNLLALAHIQLTTQTSKLICLRLGSGSNTRKLGVAHAYDHGYVPDKELESGTHFVITCSFIYNTKAIELAK
jgi:hypothetical protein